MPKRDLFFIFGEVQQPVAGSHTRTRAAQDFSFPRLNYVGNNAASELGTTEEAETDDGNESDASFEQRRKVRDACDHMARRYLGERARSPRGARGRSSRPLPVSY